MPGRFRCRELPVAILRDGPEAVRLRVAPALQVSTRARYCDRADYGFLKEDLLERLRGHRIEGSPAEANRSRSRFDQGLGAVHAHLELTIRAAETNATVPDHHREVTAELGGITGSSSSVILNSADSPIP